MVYTHCMQQWIQGLSPPQYQEVGPFSFRAKEVRYNIKFDSNWNEVEYTFHQWAEFMPASSCAQCTMAANITSINRGYLQFLSSPSPVDPETAVIYQTMPMTLSIVMGITTSIIAQVEPNSTTVAFDAVRQWTDCSFLLVGCCTCTYCFVVIRSKLDSNLPTLLLLYAALPNVVKSPTALPERRASASRRPSTVVQS